MLYVAIFPALWLWSDKNCVHFRQLPVHKFNFSDMPSTYGDGLRQEQLPKWKDEFLEIKVQVLDVDRALCLKKNFRFTINIVIGLDF